MSGGRWFALVDRLQTSLHCQEGSPAARCRPRERPDLPPLAQKRLENNRQAAEAGSALCREMLPYGTECRLDEVNGNLRSSRFVISEYRNHNADQGRIGAVVSDRVRNRVEAGAVLTCNHTIARLIPVDDDALVLTARHDIFVHFNRISSARNIQLHELLSQLRPA